MIARTIALVASKGGTSKTTLVANLMVRASQDSGRVGALDYDPQLSLARWWELRGSPPNLRVWEPSTKGAVADVEHLKKLGTEWIFIDAPPATQHIIRDCVKAADLVVIPVKASPIDLEALDPIIEICQDHETPFVFVLAMYDAKWKLSESAKPYLDRLAPGHLLREVISYRQAYVGAMIDGHTGPEYNQDAKQAKAAREEIEALWLAINKRAKAVVR